MLSEQTTDSSYLFWQLLTNEMRHADAFSSRERFTNSWCRSCLSVSSKLNIYTEDHGKLSDKVSTVILRGQLSLYDFFSGWTRNWQIGRTSRCDKNAQTGWKRLTWEQNDSMCGCASYMYIIHVHPSCASITCCNVFDIYTRLPFQTFMKN